MSEFVINREKKENKDIKMKVYTWSGREDYLDDDNMPLMDFDIEKDDPFQFIDAYAILMTKGEKTSYYVKRGKYGKLYNPIGMYSEGSSHKQLRHAGKPAWSMLITNEKVCRYYTNFLKTKNAAWLNNAERESS
jgi:hypothetical protein